MDDGHDLVVRTIRQHAPALLRTARRHSLCADDAHDAYQRAMEIFLRRAPSLDPATADRWLHVVVKHEAMAVRKARLELVGTEEAALDATLADGAEAAEDRVLRWDRLSRSAEALQRLKPQELTALWLKASGLSYAEIADRQGWTYTKLLFLLSDRAAAAAERLRWSAVTTPAERRRQLTQAVRQSESDLADATARLEAALAQVEASDSPTREQLVAQREAHRDWMDAWRTNWRARDAHLALMTEFLPFDKDDPLLSMMSEKWAAEREILDGERPLLFGDGSE